MALAGFYPADIQGWFFFIQVSLFCNYPVYQVCIKNQLCSKAEAHASLSLLFFPWQLVIIKQGHLHFSG